MSTQDAPAQCPVHDNVDRRKSAPMAAANVAPNAGARWIKDGALSRAVMRSMQGLQAGAGAEQLHYENPEHAPVFFLDGMAHRKKRLTIAKFLSPTAVTTTHRELMERKSDEIIARFRQAGEIKLENASLELAAAVVSEILGLTNSDPVARTKRIERAVRTGVSPRGKGLGAKWQMAKMIYYTLALQLCDVAPAKRARMKQRKNDVISHLIDENYSDQSIVIECLTYGSAGMMTTREFIVMVSWYLFEYADLRQRFLNADMNGQLAVLLEILRLEPVAAMLHRRVNEDLIGPDGAKIPSGELYAVDIRSVNMDEAIVGACPFAIDPDRHARMRGKRPLYELRRRRAQLPRLASGAARNADLRGPPVSRAGAEAGARTGHDLEPRRAGI